MKEDVVIRLLVIRLFDCSIRLAEVKINPSFSLTINLKHMKKNKSTPLDSAFLQTVSHRPGVYLMKGKAGQVLYVGKAKDIRKRLSSYRRSAGADIKTAALLSRVYEIETIVTTTEKEALILEASLIKKHRPKYNVILRDDKNYPLIKVTIAEEWPRVMMTRRRMRDDSRYFGPFSSASAMWETLKYIGTLFPLRKCKGKKVKSRGRPCLNFQMQRCLGPCVGKAGREEYLESVRNVLLVLEGKNRQVMDDLASSMQRASGALDFEKAGAIRDRIQAIEKTLEKQSMVASHFRDQDIFGYKRKNFSVAVSVVHVQNGVVTGQRPYFLAEPVGTDTEILSEVIRRYYADERPIPAELVVPFAPEDKEALSEWLTEKRSAKITISVPQRGERRKILEIASTNAEQIFSEREKKEISSEALMRNISTTLALSRLPKRIECLDISNIGGEQAVGSLVCFVNGDKEGAGYRHYRIRTVHGADDYAMMEEVLNRRFKKEKTDDELPDLLLVDGGKGQMNRALSVLQKHNLGERIEVAGIAKEREGEGERLYRPGRKNPIRLKPHSPVLLFLMKVRDEAHRFGITFHRKLRKKEAFYSLLDQIPGVGPKRKRLLLKELASLKRIKNATVEELSAINGIGPELGGTIHDFFNRPPDKSTK